MATTISPSAELAVLDLPFRCYNALRRNNVRTIGDLCRMSEVEFLRMRGIGEVALRELRANLADHGLSMPAAPPPPPDPTIAAEAQWIGRQLEALTNDSRVGPKNALGTQATAVSDVELRRHAWAFYRWGTTPDGQWPQDGPGGFRYMANPMPGSVELHLEGLNRLAHEELDA